MGEDDWDGWKILTKQLGARCQLVGDDLSGQIEKLCRERRDTATLDAQMGILVKAIRGGIPSGPPDETTFFGVSEAP